MEIDLRGLGCRPRGDIEWAPWGGRGDARAKVLGVANGFFVAYVEAEPGYHGDPHVHDHPEFLYVVDGKLRNQGVDMVTGDGYAAAIDSSHVDFATEAGARYLSIFKL